MSVPDSRGSGSEPGDHMTDTKVGQYGAYDALNDFWYKPAYEKLLAELAPLPPEPRVFVEVGVFHGAAVKWLLQRILELQIPDLAVHCVDTFQGWPGVSRGGELRDSFWKNVGEWADIFGYDFWLWSESSTVAANRFAPQSCDVVWLDADHSYDAVKADIAAWWPKVKPGGWIGGDDWSYAQQGGEFGVRRAVEEAFPDGVLLIPGERIHEDGTREVWPSWMVQKPKDVEVLADG